MLLGGIPCSTELELEEPTHSTGQALNIDLMDRPALATLHEVCAELMMLIGPVMWAALIALFIEAELFTK
jgi:hypothetical protein